MAIGKTNATVIISGVTPTQTTGDYKVTFIDPFGVISEQWVNDGEDAVVPTPNVYDNLTFTEWNQDTTNITSDKIIGATYSTTDGKTYVKIRLTTISGLSPTLSLNKSDTSTLTVDWGDGTTSTFTNIGNFKTGAHNYSVAGDYVISMWISVGSGTYSFGYSSSSSTFVGGTIQNYRNTLVSLFIGNSVTSIKNYAFDYCYSLTSISIPNSVTSIGSSAFVFCYSLTSISIPNSVTSIGEGAFASCFSILEYKIYAATLPTLVDVNAFTNINSICKIYVPDASLTAYKTATNWSTYANYIYPLSDLGE